MARSSNSKDKTGASTTGSPRSGEAGAAKAKEESPRTKQKVAPKGRSGSSAKAAATKAATTSRGAATAESPEASAKGKSRSGRAPAAKTAATAAPKPVTKASTKAKEESPRTAEKTAAKGKSGGSTKAATSRTSSRGGAMAETAGAPAKGRSRSGGTPARKAAASTAAPKPATKAGTGNARAKPTAAKSASSTTAKAKTSAKPAAARGRPAKPAEKPWLKSYPKEIPAEIEPFQHSSLVDLMLESCRNFADRPAFTCMDSTLTFAELEKASRDLAAYLQSTGLQKGARVAIMMPNLLQYPVAVMAVLRAGYVVVNVNPLYTARELEHQLKDSGAEAIVILENFAKTLQAAIDATEIRHVVVATMGDMMGLKGHIVNFVVRRVKKLVPTWSLPGHVTFRKAMREGASARFSPPEVGLDDMAFLQYTGGTTGVAKGAILLHRNLLANVMQSEIWLQTAYLDHKQPERPVFICVLPLYHIYAMTVNAITGIKLGVQNALITNPRDIPTLVTELGKYDFNVFVGLNTLFNALLNNQGFQKLDFSNLDFTLGGGMAVQRSVAERWKKLTGRTIHEGYGLSETSPVATINPLNRNEFTGTIGLPLPSTDIAIRDEKHREVKTGEVGEICIRGPQVMAGYWNKPDETAKTMTADGFLKSGDMGVMDENGYVRIVDRKKDMILVSGFNVYPNEIEDVLSHHPGVLEVAAIGVPDEHSGEVPKVFVVKKDPALTEADIIAFCRDKLTGYKRPRHVEFRSELPKSNVGKIMRRELR